MSTKEYMIEVALQLAESKGLTGFGMRELARAAAVANGLTYYYFKDIESLRADVVWLAKKKKNFPVLLQAIGLGYSRGSDLNEEVIGYLRGENA